MKNRPEMSSDTRMEIGEDELILHYYGESADPGAIDKALAADAALARRYAALAPSPLEHWEALEQLRALWHGYRIRVLELAQAPAAGVDTQEDLERVRAIFAAGGV